MLPALVEIVPLAAPVQAQITVPGSKSISNRALILAALGEGETVLRGALWSEDTQVMVDCLQELGFMVNVRLEPNELCNRTITVYGKSGTVPSGGTQEQPLELFVANAGTAARFLSAFVCLGAGVYRIHGTSRMHERPQAALFQALRQLGYQIDSPNNRLPATIHGDGRRPGTCAVSAAESSQFASALLLCGTTGGWQVELQGQSEEELPYVTMTTKLLHAFPKHGGEFPIEPDASSGSYFWGAGKLLEICLSKLPHPQTSISHVEVAHWPVSGWQVDARFPQCLTTPALPGEGENPGTPKLFQWPTISRRTDLADSIMTAIVLAPLSESPVEFTDLGRLRVQECERVAALRTELTKSGARVVEREDDLIICPSQLHGAEIETYGDHRMAMCFAMLGLGIPGMRLRDPGCVRKTFPDFFQKFATPPPRGLGATILDGITRRTLAIEELLAQ